MRGDWSRNWSRFQDLTPIRFRATLPVEHIAQSIWLERYSRKGLFTLLTCTFDDAGGADRGFTAVAGWIATMEQWRELAELWGVLLADSRLELRGLQGPI
jgi:hypothetical protein